MATEDTLDGGERLTLARYAERAYLDYAISVVKGRALPDAADGQKPVQRRILYAMREMGLGIDSKPRKSAAVVGDVLGKLHPHGDTSVYDALVRMAQDFSLRYPLVDGQGNFGSRDGDGAAAMRYTEARLTGIARLLLDELDEGTVDFRPNYDGTAEEPDVLPARLPLVLLNGASGIAVGLATEIPSHNLREVAQAAILLMRRPASTLDDVLAVLPGPDFPGGGQIISPSSDLRDLYAHGRGSVKVRARWRIEDLARGQWQMVVHELPPGVSSQRILEEIEELTNPKVRAGKKSLTTEQQQLKTQMLALLDAVRDESGKDAPVRLVLEPKSRNIDQDEFATALLAHTSLETGVPANLVMIGRDGKPRQKPLLDVLNEWIAFRFETVTRRTRHRLAKVDERIHLLEGRHIAFLNIERVIRLIRESDEPKDALMQAFRLSERQADDILELRLRQLARLEGIRIERELEERRAEKSGYEALLASDSVMRKSIVKEIEADAKQYGDARRTLIEEASRATIEVKVIDEPVTVIVSQKGWLRARQGHGHDAAQFAFKSGDALYGAYECRTVDMLVALGSDGRAYTVPVAALPSARGDGQPVTAFIELAAGSRVVEFHAGPPDDALVLATSAGYGFGALVSDLISRQRGGKAFVAMDEGVAPLRPVKAARDARLVAVLSDHGRVLAFPIEEVKRQATGGRGVALMALDEDERLAGIAAAGPRGVRLVGTSGSKEKTVELARRDLEALVGKRGRKGKLPLQRFKAAKIAAID